jgi:hypothetical protein
MFQRDICVSEHIHFMRISFFETCGAHLRYCVGFVAFVLHLVQLFPLLVYLILCALPEFFQIRNLLICLIPILSANMRLFDTFFYVCIQFITFFSQFGYRSPVQFNFIDGFPYFGI